MTKRWKPLWLASGFFCLVLGAKLWVIDRYGSDLPSMDQWDGEGVHLFLPYLQHRLQFADLFTSHNEHRPVFTKALNLGLLIAGGQWDARVQCVVNAAIHALFALAIFLAGCRLLGLRWHIPLFAACALLFSLPISFHNILNGFQSQFYFLFWFSLGSIWLLCRSRAGSVAWWSGVALAMLANLSAAPGLLAPMSVGVALGVRVVLGQLTWRETWPTLVGCSLAIIAGWLLRADVPEHEIFRAKSVRDFGLTTLRALQWPHGGGLAALLVQAPLLVFFVQIWRRRHTVASPEENLLLAGGFWLLLQCSASGYARGASTPFPASRYLDILAIGLVLNGVILAFMLDRWIPGEKGRRRWRIGGLVWLTVVGLAVARKVPIEPKAEELLLITGGAFYAAEKNVRAYLATNDETHLEGKIIPYPNSLLLRRYLDHPEIRAIMPVSVRAPVRLKEAVSSGSPFTARGETLITLTSYAGPPAGGSARGAWRSLPFIPAFDGYLKITTAVPAGAEGLRLQVIDAASGTAAAEVRPDPSVHGEVWRDVYLRVPRRRLLLAVTDQSEEYSLTFGEPVEMSRLSHAAMWIVNQGGTIFFLAAFGSSILLAGESYRVLRGLFTPSARS